MSGSSSVRSSRCSARADADGALAAGRAARSTAATCWSAPGRRRSGWARCSRRASARWRPPTGPGGAPAVRRRGRARDQRAARPPPPHAAPRSGRPNGPAAPTPRGRPPSTRCARWPPQDAYANLVLPGLLRERRITGRDAGLRHRAGLRHAAHARPVRRGAGRVRQPRRWTSSTTGCWTRCGSACTSCWACACPRTPRSARPSRWSGTGSGTAPAGWPTRCCARSPSGTSTTGSRAVAPDAAADPLGHLADRAQPPAVGGPGDARGAGGAGRASRAAGRRARRAARRGQRRAARSPWWPGPGWPSRPSCWPPAARPGRWSPYAVRWPAGDPGSAGGRAARAGPGCRTRAASWSPPRWRTRPLDGRDERWLDLCAGPGGKAALLGALAARRGATADRGRAGAAPGRPGAVTRWPRSATPCRCAPRTAGRSASRSRRRTTGCWSTSRAAGWVRCAGDRRRAGGATPADLATLAPLQRALLSSAPGRRPARRRGRLRHLLAARGGDPAGGGRRAAPARRTSSCWTPSGLVPVPDAQGRRLRGPSSCGRTGTAPTRCSSPCSGAADLVVRHQHRAGQQPEHEVARRPARRSRPRCRRTRRPGAAACRPGPRRAARPADCRAMHGAEDPPAVGVVRRVLQQAWSRPRPRRRPATRPAIISTTAGPRCAQASG